MRFNVMSSNKKGFTLIEVIFAVVIIAILATIAIPSVSGVLNNANRSVDNASAGLYESALKIYVSQKAQLREYVYIDESYEKRTQVANSIAMIVDSGTIDFKGKTKGWVFYYHPVTLQVVAMEFSGSLTPTGMIALVDGDAEPLIGDPDGPLLE